VSGLLRIVAENSGGVSSSDQLDDLRDEEDDRQYRSTYSGGVGERLVHQQ